MVSVVTKLSGIYDKFGLRIDLIEIVHLHIDGDLKFRLYYF